MTEIAKAVTIVMLEDDDGHARLIEKIRLSIFERRACAALGQHRLTQRKIP